jgi:hypothetical protein
MPFYLRRAQGRNLRVVTVLEPTRTTPQVQGVSLEQGAILVNTVDGQHRHTVTVEGWEIQTPRGPIRLRGEQPVSRPFRPLVEFDRPTKAQAIAVQLVDPPELDGTLAGFDVTEPLELDYEDQYRRSEEPYSGPEEFSARAYVNWDHAAIYLAVQVTKPELVVRDPDTPPLKLDNEPDEIHTDGIQVYLRLPEDEVVFGWLIVPSSAGDLIVRAVRETAAEPDWIRGSWQPTEQGYTITIAITPPGWTIPTAGEEAGLDLLINQMLPGRTRRAGQLVWSGGGGWVWLRGDRQDPGRFGVLRFH